MAAHRFSALSSKASISDLAGLLTRSPSPSPSHAPMAAHSGFFRAAACLSSQQRDCPGLSPDSLFTPIALILRTLVGLATGRFGDQIGCKDTKNFPSAKSFFSPLINTPAPRPTQIQCPRHSPCLITFATPPCGNNFSSGLYMSIYICIFASDSGCTPVSLSRLTHVSYLIVIL